MGSFPSPPSQPYSTYLDPQIAPEASATAMSTGDPFMALPMTLSRTGFCFAR